MKFRLNKTIFVLIGGLIILPANFTAAISLAERLSGRILLQVEAHGEAWYVSPANQLRYYLGRPADAFALMRGQGLGITDADLNKIPVGHIDPKDKQPEDEYTSSVRPYDPSLAKRLSGRIILQVQAHGEAWYVYPADRKRYYLGRPADAFNLMRALGLGVSDADLKEIAADSPDYQIAAFERQVFDLVNQERTKNGLKTLVWNDELAAVAREHSLDLVQENEAFTGLGVSCNFPLIHHEGLVFGTYNNNRLNNRGIYYFNKSGENIALMPAARLEFAYAPGDTIIDEVKSCEATRTGWDEEFNAKIHKDMADSRKIELVRTEITRRTEAYQKGHALDIVNIVWKSAAEIANDTVAGWLNSAGHRKNMLDADFGEAGMGTAYMNGYLITTQTFIRRADCGYKTGACCEKPGYYPYCYEPLACTSKICQ